MNSEQKANYWQQHFNAWKQSQLPQKDYCIKHNLSLATFGYWRTKLCSKPAVKPKLIPITLQKLSPAIKVFLPSGIRLEVPASTFAGILPLLNQPMHGVVDVTP